MKHRVCAVACCKAPFPPDVSFHRVPKKEPARKAWVNACKRKDKFNPDTSLICSQHFLPTDFDRDLQSELLHGKRRRKLKTGAIPTLLLLPCAQTPAISERQQRADKRERKNLLQDVLSTVNPDVKGNH